MTGMVELGVFLLIAVPICIVDLRELRIPDILSLGGIALFICLKLVFGQESFGRLAAEFFVGFGVFWLIRVVSRGKLGLGDAKLSALIAVAIGLSAWFASIFIASVIGLVFAAVAIGLFKMDRRTRLPFAPFLTAGAAIAGLAGSLHFLPDVWL